MAIKYGQVQLVPPRSTCKSLNVTTHIWCSKLNLEQNEDRQRGEQSKSHTHEQHKSINQCCLTIIPKVKAEYFINKVLKIPKYKQSYKSEGIYIPSFDPRT